MKRVSLALLLTAIFTFGVVATPPPITRIPEIARVRARLEAEMHLPIETATGLRPTTYDDAASGIRVRFEVTAQDGALYYLFLTEQPEGYPIDRAGNWIVKRSIDTGEFVQAKIFLHDRAGTFARIFPASAGSTVDLYLEGNAVYRSIPLRIDFERVIVEPMQRIIDLSRYRVDWSIFETSRRSGDRIVEAASSAVQARLGELRDSDDGALDADGTYRLIEDLSENLESGFNCSGFAKWVVDGVHYPLTGSYISIERAKKKHLALRGHEWGSQLEDERDPYFGLDWTRNLATAVRESIRGTAVTTESADVREVRFYEYHEDVGYEISELATVLYLSTLDRPGSIYLGSINQEFGEAPVLRQHTHVAVFFPYFDESGDFRVDVMERNVLTSLESLGYRYPNEFVHLVEIPVIAEIDLPRFPGDMG